MPYVCRQDYRGNKADMFADSLIQSLEIPGYRALFHFSGSLLLICLIEVLFVRKLNYSQLLQKLKIDTRAVRSIRRPIYLHILVWSTVWSLNELWSASRFTVIFEATLYTAVTILWASTVADIGARILVRLSRTEHYVRFVDEQTVGVLLIAFRVLVWSLGLYFCFLAWSIDLTGWLASAGAVGIVLGFAAKDTLANLVAGLAILADHSYQVGDFINVDDKYRGRVVRIGMRATLVQTIQDIQIAIPNALLSNGYVVNETAGESRAHRIPVSFSVAYGSDLDAVVHLVERGLSQIDTIAKAEDTRVLVKALGESGIELHAVVWVTDPSARERVVDIVLRTAYRLLGDAGIEIPFNQLDVRIKADEHAVN